MLYVDRIESGAVVCEDDEGRRVELDPALFASPPREGDCVVRAEDGRCTVDAEATEARRAALNKRFGGLFKKRTK